MNDHAVMGSQLILLAGQRLAYFIVKGDPATSLEKLSKLPPTLSTWIKSLVSTATSFGITNVVAKILN